LGMPSRRTNNFPESGRGLGHVTTRILAVRSAILATAWLLVGNRSDDGCLSNVVKLNDISLTKVDSCKYLGVIIDV